MNIYINGQKVNFEPVDNEATRAIEKRLEKGDITYVAEDYGGFEKVGELGLSLPRKDAYITTRPGDVVLYLGSRICFYYARNSWDFTRLGKLVGYTTSELKKILRAGQGDIEVRISKN